MFPAFVRRLGSVAKEFVSVQVQCQACRGIFARGVILNVGVQPIESRVELRRETQQQLLAIEITQMKQPPKYFERGRAPRGCGALGSGFGNFSLRGNRLAKY